MENKTTTFFEIKKSNRARYMRIEVSSLGKVRVIQPAHINNLMLKQFLHEKTAWIREKIDYFKSQYSSNILTPKKQGGKREYNLCKEQARRIVHSRLKYFNTFYNFQYNRIAIRSQKTRWGSCSKRGNLNFNYKIVFLKPAEQDYIIVHELCHLKEFNHGKKFWMLVEQQIPNFRELRASIRKFQL